MIQLAAPAHMTVTELMQEARHESAQFRRGQLAGSACAFELFRRAIVLRDEYAWSALYELYRAVVVSWILRRDAGVSSDDLAWLENEVFAKFARSIDPERLVHFHSVSALLAYLKCCANSVAADYRRSCQVRCREETLESLEDEPAPGDLAEEVVEELAAQEIWRVIAREARAPEERLILVLICAQGMSPRELQQRYPTLFADVEDVYRVKRNVLERLRHNRQLLALRSSQKKVSTPYAVPSHTDVPGAPGSCRDRSLHRLHRQAGLAGGQ